MTAVCCDWYSVDEDRRPLGFIFVIDPKLWGLSSEIFGLWSNHLLISPPTTNSRSSSDTEKQELCSHRRRTVFVFMIKPPPELSRSTIFSLSGNDVTHVTSSISGWGFLQHHLWFLLQSIWVWCHNNCRQSDLYGAMHSV